MVKATIICIGAVLAGFAAWMLWGGTAARIQNLPIVDTRMHGTGAGAPATLSLSSLQTPSSGTAENGHREPLDQDRYFSPKDDAQSRWQVVKIGPKCYCDVGRV